MKWLILLALAPLVLGQDGTNANLSQGPPYTEYQKLYFYNGSNLEYVCVARSIANSTRVTIASATAANPGVFTSVAHGFAVGVSARVTVSGGTGAWTEANGTWLISPVDADTFTLRDTTTGTQLDTTGNGALAGTVTMTSTAPRETGSQWAIQKFTYSGSNLIGSFWAVGSSGRMQHRCSDRAATTVEWR